MLESLAKYTDMFGVLEQPSRRQMDIRIRDTRFCNSVQQRIVRLHQQEHEMWQQQELYRERQGFAPQQGSLSRARSQREIAQCTRGLAALAARKESESD